MNRILVLDIATTTGWALTASGVTTSGSQCFARQTANRTRPADHVGAPFAMFHRWFMEKLRTDKPTLIVYEGAGYFKSAAAAQICIGLRGVMLMDAAAMNIPVKDYAPKEVKKFWTGNGNADKPAMVAETIRRIPEMADLLSDANEADALAILHLHLSKTTPAPALSIS